MKRLNDKEEKFLQTIIDKNNALFQMEGKVYTISLVQEERPSKVPTQPSFIEEKKQNILDGKEFSIDDVVDMMDSGVL
ncbi:hypothetical protein [Oceanobacillus manasiensis]|uniref:hypothetical protein n=1 Tax=Oceanobacillus manasiensis TaxID=586413 RepID=UPI0005A9D113|nr:hypothetical protein [Oceanobacillus manasiensis]